MKKNNIIYIKIALLLLILIVLYNIFINKKESFEQKQNIYAMTFGGGGQNYYDAVNRINNELKVVNIFDDIILKYDTDLKNDVEFWNKHGNFIENNKKGYGYWIWKPYLILKMFDTMNDNDILLHIDAGCEIVNNEDTYNKIKLIIEKCNNYNMLYSLAGHSEKKYTKMDLFTYMNVNYQLNIDDELKNSIMNQSTIIFIKKNELNIKFINDWYNICCNYNLIDDTPSIEDNDITFIEHRHPQSIMSLLLKTNNYNKYLNTDNNKILDNTNSPNGDIYPFLLSRKRHG